MKLNSRQNSFTNEPPLPIDFNSYSPAGTSTDLKFNAGGHKRPPSTFGIEKSLGKYLGKIQRSEASLESLRQALGVNRDFEPLSAFQRIDRNDDLCVTAHEILRFLRENSIASVTEEDCQNLISYYFEAPSEHQYLNFKDFLDLVLPQDDEVLRFTISQRPRTLNP